jgi:hypothetical protein
VGQDGILRADGIGAVRSVLLIGNKPVDNRLQDVILPHYHSWGYTADSLV